MPTPEGEAPEVNANFVSSAAWVKLSSSQFTLKLSSFTLQLFTSNHELKMISAVGLASTSQCFELANVSASTVAAMQLLFAVKSLNRTTFGLLCLSNLTRDLNKKEHTFQQSPCWFNGLPAPEIGTSSCNLKFPLHHLSSRLRQRNCRNFNFLVHRLGFGSSCFQCLLGFDPNLNLSASNKVCQQHVCPNHLG